MENPLNENRPTGPDPARRNRLRITWADVWSDPREPLIIIQTTILTFIILVVFLTPILISCYGVIHSLTVELKLFYQLIFYPMMPNFPHAEVAKGCLTYLNTFLVAGLVMCILIMWRTTYFSIRGIIELMYNGELFLL